MPVKMQDRPVIYVRMLGEFSLSYQQALLTENSGRVKKVWWLIEYLIAGRGRDISPDALVELLWSEKDSENPMNSLKNLVYRARTMLRTLCPENPPEFILFGRNTYAWNPALPCVVDAEEFERLFKAAENRERSAPERLADYEKAFALYQGEFLPKSSFMDWVIAKNAYYQTVYVQCTLHYLALLEQAGRYDAMVRVGEQAVGFTPWEESIHQQLLRAYAATGQQKKALEHYNHISDQFYNEFGVKLLSETVQIYRDIVRSMHNVELDLDVIKEDLQETCGLEGAFFCEYDIFKQIYRLQARSMARSGLSIYIALITFADAKGQVPETGVIKKVIASLSGEVTQCLRKGDVVSVYSSTQLVLMLPLTTYEDGKRVLDRVVRQYTRKHRNPDIQISTRLRAVDPVELAEGGDEM